jgi:hypothetical protein
MQKRPCPARSEFFDTEGRETPGPLPGVGRWTRLDLIDLSRELGPSASTVKDDRARRSSPQSAKIFQEKISA